MVFTADEFADGAELITSVLKKQKIRASFFLTGRFYRNPSFKKLIPQLKKQGYYLGAHSDQHMLYCDWSKRDSLLVSREQFLDDLHANYVAMQEFGISKNQAQYFLPPYEWFNDSISTWTNQYGLQLVNFSPGTHSTADYTWPLLSNYKSSDQVYQSILVRENLYPSGLNGFVLLLHIGTDPRRSDKFYPRLDSLLKELKGKGYRFVRIDELFSP